MKSTFAELPVEAQDDQVEMRCPASGIWLSFGVGKVGAGGQVGVSGEPPVEGFVGLSGVEDLALGLDVMGRVDAVVDLVPVELLVLERAESAFANAVGAR